MKIEKKNKTEQIFFGKIVALQPKKSKKDKGADGTPLFSQETEDGSQMDIFDKNKETNDEVQKKE